MKIPDVGLIGHGRFGAMAAGYLRPGCRLRITDENPERLEGVEEAAGWAEVAACGIVVLAVPISAVSSVARKLAPSLRPGQLVIDTCSVKQQPLVELKAALPESVQILGTHPLFGPDSGKDGIRGLKIAVCPARVDAAALDRVRRFLEGLGLDVIETTAEEHDRQLARSQAIFHLIAKALKNLGWGGLPLSTPGPDSFFRLVGTVQSDTDQLFRDLEQQNPFAAEYRRRFIQELKSLDDDLVEGS